MSSEDGPDLLTPGQVARFLMGLSKRLDELVAEFRTLGYEAAQAKRTAEAVEARAWLDPYPEDRDRRVTVEERKRVATLASSEARFNAEVAMARLNACREAIRAVTIRIDVGRTLSATSRAEMRELAGGQHT